MDEVKGKLKIADLKPNLIVNDLRLLCLHVELREGVEVEIRDGQYPLWDCECVCKNLVTVNANSIINDNTKSCGCLKESKFKAHASEYAKMRDYSIEINGKKKRIKEAMEKDRGPGVTKAEVYRRRRQGWSWQEAVTRPAGPKSQNYKDLIEVFGEKLTRTAAVKKYGKVSRQAVYERVAGGMSWEEALTKEHDHGTKSKEDKPLKRSSRNSSKKHNRKR